MSAKQDYFAPYQGHKYDWMKWTDGKQHVLEKGTDFKTPTVHFQSYVALWARNHGFTVRTRKLSQTSLAIQFTKVPKTQSKKGKR